MTLIGLLIIVLAGNLLANGNDDQRKAERKLEHPLLEKVFPAVEFIITRKGSDIKKKLYVKYNDELYIMDSMLFGFTFNELISKTNEKSKASLDEKIEIFARLYACIQLLNETDTLEGIKNRQKYKKNVDEMLNINDFSITEVKNTTKDDSLKTRYKNYNYKAEWNLDGHYWLLYIRLLKGNILEAEISKDLGPFKNIIIMQKSMNREINIHITGGVQEPTPTPNPLNCVYISVSINGIDTNSNISFDITGLPQEDTTLKIEPLYGSEEIPAAFVDGLEFGYDTISWTPPNNNKTGIYSVKIFNNSGIEIYQYWGVIITEHKISGNFKDSEDNPIDYIYSIYYTNQFSLYYGGLDYAPIYADYVKVALEESWQKQVIDWNLAMGCEYNLPNDFDNNYEVFINDSDFWYHIDFGNNHLPGNERKMGIRSNCYITQPGYSSELMRIKVAVAHEFFHGIQFSHNPSYTEVDSLFDWLYEGQAYFINSVQYEHEEFFIDTSNHFFPVIANGYLENHLTTSIHNMDVFYLLFWRFLYENYLEGTTKEKLAIIRETCRGNTNSDLSEIKSFMDLKLSSNGGSYSTFDEAITTFAKYAYFNQPAYGNWDPNSTGFYTTPTIKSTNTLWPNVRSNVTENASIPVSFGIDYHIVNIRSEVNAATVKISKTGVNGASFAVQIWAMQDAAIVDSFLVILSETDTIAACSFVTKDVVNQFVINLVRFDTNESDPSVDSAYTLNVYPGTLVSGNQSGNWVIENSPYLIAGDITVPAGQTLNIEAGVSVYALDYYGFSVSGTVNANGIENARVVFSAVDPVTGWRGIRFYPGSKNRTPSEFEYTTFEYAKNFSQDHYFDYAGYILYGAGSAIFAFQSPLNFTNCIFRNCSSYAGGAMYLMNGSNVNITNSEFYENTATDLGGAIAISNNYIFEGFSSTHTFRDLLIYNNTTGIYGGSAIYINQNVLLFLIGSTVYNNYASNHPEYFGASFFIKEGSWLYFVDGILRSEQPAEVILSDYSYGSRFIAYTSNIKNGNSCFYIHHWASGQTSTFTDIINVNPMFEEGSFNLQQTSLCIDGGGFWDGATDPDGTIDDMGYGYYHQPLEVSQPSDVTISLNSRNFLTLDWSQSNGAIYYKIFESDNPIDSFTLLDSIRADTFYHLEFDGSHKFYYIKSGNNRTRTNIKKTFSRKIDIQEIYIDMNKRFQKR
jgi:hypothetical protein